MSIGFVLLPCLVQCEYLSHTQCLSLFCIHSSSSGGGGGGSGGSISFSACTLTAGSSAKIEAKGGEGGDARNIGTRICFSCLFSHACLNLSF